MNAAHFHLMINHLPIIGLLIAMGVLFFGFLGSKPSLVPIGLWLVLLTTLSTVPAYFSGESAEEVVEHLPGVRESLIEAHEEGAEIALMISQLTGLLALGSLFAKKKSDFLFKTGSMATLAGAIGTFVILGWVANLGGQISHPELREGEGESTRGEYRHHDDD